MLNYIIRRLLLMVPTFIGILLINFGILRLNGWSLTAEMHSASMWGEVGGGSSRHGGGGGEKASASSRSIENYIDKFRRRGDDLPALLNFRGFWTEQDVVGMLRDSAPDSPLKPSRRGDIEKDLWLAGHFAVPLLAKVLADDSLKDLHPAASMAFSLCAHTTEEQFLEQKRTSSEIDDMHSRNRELNDNRFTATDPDRETKRRELLDLYRRDAGIWKIGRGERWTAIVRQTGFVEIMRRLFTGQLWSDSKQANAFSVIGRRWYISAGLNITSIILSWLVSIPLGIRAARVNGSLEERTTTNILFLLWSMPSFFLGTVLLHLLCTRSGGHEPLFSNLGIPGDEVFWYSTPHFLANLAWHAFLPLVVLTYGSFTAYSRYMRGNLLDQLGSDYVRTARAKGCSEDRVVYRHAVRNSMLTMITLSAGLLSELFGGFVVVEWIFSVPGLGMLNLEAAQQFDAPLLMASTVISVTLLLFGILIADLLYGLVDPRIRARYA